MRTRSLTIVLAIALFIMMLLATGAGSTSVDPGMVLAALAGSWAEHLGLTPVDEGVQSIVRDLRLPRTILAALVGASLAMVGALLQTATRNDLADPFLFGLSSGAAVGAVAVITITGERFGVWSLPLAAFSGGLVAAACVLLLAHRTAGLGAEKIVLAGLAISFLFGSLTHAMVFAGDQRAAHSVLFWSLGGLGMARWNNLPLAATALIALGSFVILRHRSLDALLAGDDTAHSLGVNPERLRRQVFIVAALATACCVALTGVIGFIGLMVPHLARGRAGLLHAALVPASALMGALLLLASDLLSRGLIAPQELPVGIVTGGIGAAFVIAMLLRRADGPR
jgi:iron complex transport system permease protein